MKMFWITIVVGILLLRLFLPSLVGWFILLVIMGIILVPIVIPNKYFIPKKK